MYRNVHRHLDEVSQGLLTDLASACKALHLKPYVMVQTHHEGLPKGQMKLIAIGIDSDGSTRFFETARVPREAQAEGWELKTRLALEEAN